MQTEPEQQQPTPAESELVSKILACQHGFEWTHIRAYFSTQAATIKHLSDRLAKQDNALSDIGKILGDESMAAAKIIERVRELVSCNKHLRQTVDRYEAQWIDEHV